ncbi:MAG: hypothetical protein K0S48_3191 [Ramlibacter sp.]|nr:hypothetical protein [Ramlibacter sp.]
MNLLSSPLARCAALLLPLLLAACGDKAADTQAAPKPALTVTTTMPTQAMLPVTLPANGNLAAWQEASIAARRCAPTPPRRAPRWPRPRRAPRTPPTTRRGPARCSRPAR